MKGLKIFEIMLEGVLGAIDKLGFDLDPEKAEAIAKSQLRRRIPQAGSDEKRAKLRATVEEAEGE